MSFKHILVLLGAGLALLLALFLVLNLFWPEGQPEFAEAPKLIQATHAFALDMQKSGMPMPAYVSLPMLVRGGFLTQEDIRPFRDMEVRIWTQLDDKNPHNALVTAKLRDGTITALLADGSVQQLTEDQYNALPIPPRPPAAAPK